jgi:hypothetical protein
MGSGLGMFDVSSFFNGDGFIVRHVDSGELLEVSIFSDGIGLETDSVVILVVLTTPAWSRTSSFEENPSKTSSPLSSRKASSDSLKKMFKETGSLESKQNDDTSTAEALPQKRVVVANMDGQAYNCEVVVTKTGDDNALARVPCSPGFFGEAHMQNLVENEGVRVQGPLHLPPEGELSSSL